MCVCRHSLSGQGGHPEGQRAEAAGGTAPQPARPEGLQQAGAAAEALPGLQGADPALSLPGAEGHDQRVPCRRNALKVEQAAWRPCSVLPVPGHQTFFLSSTTLTSLSPIVFVVVSVLF